MIPHSNTNDTPDCKMGGTKKWLGPHVKFCFSKFTNSAEDGKWCIVGEDSSCSPALVVPNATRGSSDPVKCWYDQAHEEQAELFSTINLQCFRTNVKNTASKWYKGAHRMSTARIPCSVSSSMPSSLCRPQTRCFSCQLSLQQRGDA